MFVRTNLRLFAFPSSKQQSNSESTVQLCATTGTDNDVSYDRQHNINYAAWHRIHTCSTACTFSMIHSKPHWNGGTKPTALWTVITATVTSVQWTKMVMLTLNVIVTESPCTHVTKPNNASTSRIGQHVAEFRVKAGASYNLRKLLHVFRFYIHNS